MPDDGTGASDFGFSVGVHGDRLLIAAANADVDGVTAQGKAYLFTYAVGSWTQSQTIVADDDGGANFGYALAYDGVNALISSPFSNVGDNLFQGAVYAYVDDGSTLTQTQKLVTSEAQTIRRARHLAGAGRRQRGDRRAVRRRQPGRGLSVPAFRRRRWVEQLAFTASDSVAGDGAAYGFSAAISGNSLLFGQALATINENASQGAAYFYNAQLPDDIFVDGFDGP